MALNIRNVRDLITLGFKELRCVLVCFNSSNRAARSAIGFTLGWLWMTNMKRCNYCQSTQPGQTLHRRNKCWRWNTSCVIFPMNIFLSRIRTFSTQNALKVSSILTNSFSFCGTSSPGPSHQPFPQNLRRGCAYASATATIHTPADKHLSECSSDCHIVKVQ